MTNSQQDPASLEAPAQTVAYELNGNCYLNLTARCTLRCSFCPKFNGSWEVQGYDLSPVREPTVAEMIEALGDLSRYQEIVFCGLGEPTLRLDAIIEVGRVLKASGAVTRLNTDGLASLVHQRDTAHELAAVVDRVSISLNAQNEAIYNKYTRPKLEGAYVALLEFARDCRDAGMDVTLTAIDGLEGVDVSACEEIARSMKVKFRRRFLDEVG